MENTSRISFAKCQTKVYLIGQLVTNQILTYFDKKYCSLSNGENRNSLSNIVFELFKKQPMVLYFGTDSRNCLDLFGATWNYLELLEATWSYLNILDITLRLNARSTSSTSKQLQVALSTSKYIQVASNSFKYKRTLFSPWVRCLWIYSSINFILKIE